MKINQGDIIQIFFISLPFFVALTGCLIIGFAWRNSINLDGRRLHRRLLFYLLALLGTWIGRFIYFFHPEIFIFHPSLHGFPILYLPVTLYTYIHRLLYGAEERPVWRHYILPFILGAVLSPVRQPEILWQVTGQNGVLGMLRLHLLFSVVYYGLTLRMFFREYKKKRLSSQFSLMPSGWLWLLIATIALHLVDALAGLTDFSKGEHISLSFFIPRALLGSQLTGMLLYQVICRDLYLFTPMAVNKGTKGIGQPGADTRGKEQPPLSHDPTKPELPSRPVPNGLSRQKFERHVFKHKPYLNPKLSLKDYAEQLDTNRSYLSAFVNREYGMNFSQYVNSCRLRELEYQRSLPQNKGMNLRKLSVKAGFGTYESYLKARKKAQEEPEDREKGTRESETEEKGTVKRKTAKREEAGKG